MSRRGKRIGLAVLGAAALFAAGCGVPPTRIEFIEKMAQENRQIARSTRPFREAILPLKNGQPVDASKVRSTYNDMKKTVSDVKADMNAQLLPTSSNSAKDFLDAYKAYLDGEQGLLDNEFQQIVQEVENGTATWDLVNGQLNAINAKENELFSRVAAAQQAYASEHNYQPMGVEIYLNNERNGH